MSKLTVETDKYGLVRVKVETTKSGTPVTYRAPAREVRWVRFTDMFTGLFFFKGVYTHVQVIGADI